MFDVQKINIKNLTLKELEEDLQSLGENAFRARQIYQWLYQKGVTTFDEMTNISKKLQLLLKDRYSIIFIDEIKKFVSKDKSVKYLFLLPKDSETIESVFMPWEDRNTICISSQVGCKMNCTFCATGSMGFKRNLETYEIIEQILHIKKDKGNPMLPCNIVFMGMGEPLDNYDNLVKSLNILNENLGLQIGIRKITISTCGLVDKIYRLAGEGKQIGLAISLNAADDKKRDKIMPINKKYPLKELIKAAIYFSEKVGRRVTFEYILFDRFNDTEEDARLLGKLLDFPCKINLIPYNKVENTNFESPSYKNILKFQENLFKYSNNVITIRDSRGGDVAAACGQLKQRLFLKNEL